MPNAFALDIEATKDDARTSLERGPVTQDNQVDNGWVSASPDAAQMGPDQEAGIAFLAEQVSP